VGRREWTRYWAISRPILTIPSFCMSVVFGTGSI